MKHLSFVLWMLGYPLVCAISHLIYSWMSDKPITDEAKTVVIIFDLLIWFVIGALLWKHA